MSLQAQARMAAGAGADLPLPDFRDLAAVARWRAAQHDAWGEGTVVGEPEHRRVMITGVPCLVAGPKTGPAVMYLHGGGFVLGSAGVAAPITARLASAGLRVVSVDYRLAPEHPFPAALDDALAVYDTLAAGTAVAVAGDSAGGGLAVSVSLRLQARPFALALLCPFLDHAAGGPMSDAYLAGTAAGDAAASPLHAVGLALPPTLVQTGTRDALHAQSLAFAERANVTLDIWPRLWHTWQYHRDLPEADEALARVAAFIAAKSP